MRRRDLILGIGAAGAWSLVASAQTTPKRLQVGFLFPGAATAAQARSVAVLDGLRTVGYDPDQIELLLRMSNGDLSRIPALASDLSDRKIDAIVAVSPPAVQAARATTATIPIIAHDLETDPIAAGFVQSFARPGGNLTGFFFDFPEFSKKWLELLREISPAVTTLGVLLDPATGLAQRQAIEQVAGPPWCAPGGSGCGVARGVGTGVRHARQASTECSRYPQFADLGLNPELVAGLTLRHRFVASTLFPEFARAGGLMAYGPDLLDTFREVGAMTGKVASTE